MPETILAALESGDVPSTISRLKSLVAHDRGRRTLTFVERCLDRLPDTAGVTRVSVYVLRSVTLDPLVGFLRAHGLAHGLDIRVSFGEFNQFEQELAGGGSLPEAAPGVLVIAARLEEIAPVLVHRFIGIGPEVRASAVADVTERMESWLDAATRRWPRAQCIVSNFAEPAWGALGLAETSSEGQRSTIRALNARLLETCRSRSGTYVFDLDGVLADVGRSRAFDERRMATAHLPYSDAALDAIAAHLARVLSAIVTKRRKCLVLDGDNTLWGGVVGEDGPEGIKLGPDYPGSAWMAFQRAVLNLHDRGVILALNTKNEEHDITSVLRDHPFQILRPEHFAACRVNWQDKATNLIELAAELNIGLDSMVFVDDSEFECAWVRERLPEVAVHTLPRDPLGLVAFLDGLDAFDMLRVSNEDLTRGQMYQAAAARKQAQDQSTSLDDFLRGLEMRLGVHTTTSGQIARVAQLTQRTNQFNLMTRRYTEADIRSFLTREDTDVFHIDLADRFGEYGVTGVLITRIEGSSLWVDTLLLSCRILGRRVEDALFAFLLRHARSRDAETVIGEYRPTQKNAQTADLYPRYGFSERDRDGDTIRFERSVHDAIAWPDWFTLKLPDEHPA